MKHAALGSVALLCALLSLVTGTRVSAETYTVGSIEITNPWARATPKGASVGGGYMTINNKGTETDRLLGGTSPVAAKLEVHQMSMSNGVMTMRPVPGGLEIKPGQTVVLDPDSFHVMIMGLKQQLTPGEHVKATLDFAKAGNVEVEYVVGSVGARGPDNGASSGKQMPGMQMNHPQ
jgi:periplasmic copper chaperone A